MSLRDTFRAELAARRTDRAPWPAAIEDLVTEGRALDESCQRGEPVDRERASEIVRELEAYVDALPEHEQSRVSKALARRFISEAA